MAAWPRRPTRVGTVAVRAVAQNGRARTVQLMLAAALSGCMSDYHPVPDADREAFRRGRYYAFAPEEGPTAHESGDEIAGTHRGLYDGETLVSACSYHHLSARVREAWLDVGGVAGVATPPEHRRRGLAGRLLGELLAEFRAEGIPVAALWPLDREYYARLGWAQACTSTRYECAPSVLASAAADPAGEFRRWPPDEAHRLEPVFEAWLADHSLATRRDEAWWRDCVVGADDERYVYAWVADGEPRGYLVYDVEGDWHAGRTLAIRELAYADPEARRQLWRFLATHDSQVESVELALPAETRLLDEVADPDAVECTVVPGPMVRLASVAHAVEALSYPEIEGTVRIAVADPLADWNDDVFEITFADGRATCEPAPDADPDVRAGVGALSQLFVGYRSLAALRKLDAVAVESPDRAVLLADAFPQQPVWLPERF